MHPIQIQIYINWWIIKKQYIKKQETIPDKGKLYIQMFIYILYIFIYH